MIKYDNIKETEWQIDFRYPPCPPSAELLEAVERLAVAELEKQTPWVPLLQSGSQKTGWERPGKHTDQFIAHPEDPKRIEEQPRIFIGPIASSDTLLKNPRKRDELREQFNIKAVEMESSGIAAAAWNQQIGFLAVRGICDYCDENKDDRWHKYASLAAAAYTKALLSVIPGSDKGTSDSSQAATSETIRLTAILESCQRLPLSIEAFHDLILEYPSLESAGGEDAWLKAAENVLNSSHLIQEAVDTYAFTASAIETFLENCRVLAASCKNSILKKHPASGHENANVDAPALFESVVHIFEKIAHAGKSISALPFSAHFVTCIGEIILELAGLYNRWEWLNRSAVDAGAISEKQRFADIKAYLLKALDDLSIDTNDLHQLCSVLIDTIQNEFQRTPVYVQHQDPSRNGVVWIKISYSVYSNLPELMRFPDDEPIVLGNLSPIRSWARPSNKGLSRPEIFMRRLAAQGHITRLSTAPVC